jgi:hypothetical protein
MGDGGVGSVRGRAMKRRPASPQDRAVAARVAAGRPPSTPTPGYVLEALAELDGDPGDLLAEWEERAAVRQYLGEMLRADAERAALGELIDAHAAQGDLP